MKHSLLLLLLISIVGCTEDAPTDNSTAIVQYTRVVILTDELFQVGANAADMSTTITTLGPRTRQIDISICGHNVKWQTVDKLTNKLKASGYNRIAFETDGDRDEKLQALCSNYAIKGTSE
jgi:hypothetical protein